MIHYFCFLVVLAKADPERSESARSSLPNWAVSVLPMPPPLKRRPNFKPEPKTAPDPEISTPPRRPEESQLSMAELILQVPKALKLVSPLMLCMRKHLLLGLNRIYY